MAVSFSSLTATRRCIFALKGVDIKHIGDRTVVDLKVFVSFEFDRDKQLKGCFVSQANRNEIPLKIVDTSLLESVKEGSWRKRASQAIQNSDLVVVLVGQDTTTANGVQDELNLALQYDVPRLQIRPQGRKYGSVRNGGPLHAWKWKTIRNHLAGKHYGCRTS